MNTAAGTSAPATAPVGFMKWTAIPEGCGVWGFKMHLVIGGGGVRSERTRLRDISLKCNAGRCRTSETRLDSR